MRDLLIIIAGLGIPLLIQDIPFRVNVIFLSLGLAAVAGSAAFIFVFRQDVHVRWTASGLFLMNGAAMAISALSLTPFWNALNIGVLVVVAMGWGYAGLHFSRRIRHR